MRTSHKALIVLGAVTVALLFHIKGHLMNRSYSQTFVDVPAGSFDLNVYLKAYDDKGVVARKILLGEIHDLRPSSDRSIVLTILSSPAGSFQILANDKQSLVMHCDWIVSDFESLSRSFDYNAFVIRPAHEEPDISVLEIFRQPLNSVSKEIVIIEILRK